MADRQQRASWWRRAWARIGGAPTLGARADVLTSITAARQQATREALARREDVAGAVVDPDFDGYRRLTTGKRLVTRDLSPLQQERMIELVAYLFESNPFAQRLVTLSSDLIVGDGVRIEAVDPRVQALLDYVWTHPRNQFPKHLREMRNALGLFGELLMPVSVAPVSGVAIFGFLDPSTVQDVVIDEANVRLARAVTLKPATLGGAPTTLQVVTRNDAGTPVGEIFFERVGGLPHAKRGRSELLAAADWLDLFDQLVFQELERVKLLGSYVYDLTMKGATQQQIEQRKQEFPVPQSGSMFIHNDNEALELLSPDVKADERVETAKMLATHIAGSMGFPLTWLGFTESNRATIEGQNDVLLKTPSAKQRQFGELIHGWLSFAVAHAVAANRVLYRGADLSFRVHMPEIAAKDLARAGATLSQVVAANDTAMANKTLPRRAAVQIQAAMITYLGIDLGSADDLLAQIDQDVADEVERTDAAIRQRQQQTADAADDDEGGDDEFEAV